MKKEITVFKKIFALLFLASSFSYADPYSDGAIGLNPDTKTTVNVSTIASAPTQIMTRDSYLYRSYIVNFSTFTLFLSSVSTGMSTTGSFGIPGSANAGVAAAPWSPDGLVAWWGPMFAVLGGSSTVTGGNSVGVFRSK